MAAQGLETAQNGLTANRRDTEVVDALERYRKTVYGVALTHTNNRCDADDVFQEVFVAYLRSSVDFADEEHRKAWLIRTTLNLSLKLVTSSWRSRTELCEPGAPALSVCDPSLPPSDFAFSDPRADEVFAALRALPTDYRITMHLFYLEDLPVSAIANVLGTTEGAIKTRLSRARAMVRDSVHETACNE
jgi:RNA polymerase sigma-70 factor (ECF subfamily)